MNKFYDDVVKSLVLYTTVLYTPPQRGCQRTHDHGIYQNAKHRNIASPPLQSLVDLQLVFCPSVACFHRSPFQHDWDAIHKSGGKIIISLLVYSSLGWRFDIQAKPRATPARQRSKRLFQPNCSPPQRSGKNPTNSKLEKGIQCCMQCLINRILVSKLQTKICMYS
jgi:hypothetical protein